MVCVWKDNFVGKPIKEEKGNVGCPYGPIERPKSGRSRNSSGESISSDDSSSFGFVYLRPFDLLPLEDKGDVEYGSQYVQDFGFDEESFFSSMYHLDFNNDEEEDYLSDDELTELEKDFFNFLDD